MRAGSRACATNDKQMIKSAKPITHLLRENYADGTHSLAAHVLNMRFYIHPVAGYQCDRQIVELGGEKRELRGEGAVASARRASLPGPPPQCEMLPHSHCSRINLLVSFFSGKTPRDCLLRQSWPCGAGFFLFPRSKLSIKRQFHISQSGCGLQNSPATCGCSDNHSFISTGRKFEPNAREMRLLSFVGVKMYP